ncbi:hypothetical protein KSS87_004353, partial [Heliosperma pusillum]
MGNKGRLNVHTRSYIAKKWVMKERRLIVHTRSYNANNGEIRKDLLFTQGITMQTMGNERGKTYYSHRE